MRVALTSALALSIALAGCLAESSAPSAGEPPAADPPQPFTVEAHGCRELLVLFTIPVAQARAFVPSNYTLLGEATGQAQGLAGLKECDATTMDGVDVGL